MSDEIHIYRAPPQTGDAALCGHVREELDGLRLHRSDNQCEECARVAEAEGLTLVERGKFEPAGYWRLSQPRP